MARRAARRWRKSLRRGRQRGRRTGRVQPPEWVAAAVSLVAIVVVENVVAATVAVAIVVAENVVVAIVVVVIAVVAIVVVAIVVVAIAAVAIAVVAFAVFAIVVVVDVVVVGASTNATQMCRCWPLHSLQLVPRGRGAVPGLGAAAVAESGGLEQRRGRGTRGSATVSRLGHRKDHRRNLLMGRPKGQQRGRTARLGPAPAPAPPPGPRREWKLARNCRSRRGQREKGQEGEPRLGQKTRIQCALEGGTSRLW